MIDFVSNIPTDIAREIIADYESRTGKTLQPAQAERILIDCFAYRESLLRGQINSAANQNLVEFSSAPVLDFLGALVGVNRIGAVPARTTLRFVLTAGHSGVTIPAGTRVTTTDGLVVFETEDAVTVGAGATPVDVPAVCQTDGTAGNDYTEATITTILDPQAFIVSASNITVTAGGSNPETDQQLRERIKLAPASFSVAGPRAAYVYFAKTASPLIIDVAVTSPNPGVVNIYPLIDSTEPTPTEILDLVEAVVNDDRVRPLTDTVNVIAPTKANYVLQVEIVLFTNAHPDTQARVTAALNAFVTAKRQTMGQDVVRSQIIAAAQLPGVYSVNVVTPSADVVVTANEFPVSTYVAVTVLGTTNG